jgi:hypothetical protein
MWRRYLNTPGARPCWIIFATGVGTDAGCTVLIAGHARPSRLHALDQCVVRQKKGGNEAPVASAFLEKAGRELFGEFDDLLRDGELADLDDYAGGG